MNPWEVFTNALGWFLLVLFVMLALVIFWAIVVNLLKWVRGWFNESRASKGTSIQDYTREAAVVAQDMFKDEIILQTEQIDAFKAGARWGWGFFHRP